MNTFMRCTLLAALTFSAGACLSAHEAQGRLAPVEAMPSPRAVHSATRLHDGRVLVSGSGDAEILSSDHQQFSPLSTDIGRKLAFATATPLADGRVLILGGYDSDIRVDRGAWIFE